MIWFSFQSENTFWDFLIFTCSSLKCWTLFAWMISRQKCVMHIHTSKRKFGYDMCNAPDILINLRFIVSNLCTKSIIDANYGILSRLSRSDRFFKVNHIEISNFQTLKKFQFLILFDDAKSQEKCRVHCFWDFLLIL